RRWPSTWATSTGPPCCALRTPWARATTGLTCATWWTRAGPSEVLEHRAAGGRPGGARRAPRQPGLLPGDLSPEEVRGGRGARPLRPGQPLALRPGHAARAPRPGGAPPGEARAGRGR